MNRSIDILAVFIALLFGTGFSALATSWPDEKRDTITVTSVSDTLNVSKYSFDGWLRRGLATSGLNIVHGLHDYHPGYIGSILRNDLGNLGSADHKVLFDVDQPFGFNFRSGRKNYWKSLDDRWLLISPKMFSNVNYVNGAERENYLIANLTRGFGKLVNLGFHFNRINSLGFYDRQRTVFTDLSFYGTFRTKNSRYKAVIVFDYSDLDVEENGGLRSDSVFEENLTSSRNFVPVNLNSASNRWKGFDVGLKHRFKLTDIKQDSLETPKYFLPALSHSFSIGRHSMIYRDIPDTSLGFYENIYLDSALTYDSTNLLSVKNEVRFELVKSDSVQSKFLNALSAGVGHEYVRVANDTLIRNVNNVSVLFHAGGAVKGFGWDADGKLMVFGNNIGDLQIKGNLRYKLKRSEFQGFVQYSLFHPDEITSRYISNHFAWNNSWSQTSHLKAGLVYEQRKLRFRASMQYHLLDKLVAYGTDRLPYQSQVVNQLMVLKAKEHFILKWFHVELELAGQFKLSGDDIRVPMFLGRGMLYYQNDIFKRRLRLQIGVETNYSTAYSANAYNPALSAFHVQNEKMVGNYPFIDVFLNFRVKKFRAFVKVEHVNAGWLGYRYYHIPHYPTNDLAWKFGINWAFLD